MKTKSQESLLSVHFLQLFVLNDSEPVNERLALGTLLKPKFNVTHFNTF